MIKREKDLPFIITVSYLVALITIRFLVFVAGSARSQFAVATQEGLPPGVKFYLGKNIILFGYHIHHFYIGIFLVCVAGWIAIVGSKHLTNKNLAVMYGAGLGLILDEIGLLLTWGNYYSSLSYVICMLMLGVFLSIVFFSNFWESVKIDLINVKSRTLVWNKFFRNNLVVNTINKISKTTGKTDNTVLVFSGILYILLSVFIFKYREFVRYWVSVTFVLHAATCFVRAFKNENMGE
ncbi:MAG: hypothetical protein U9P79_10280 [Candidatus Cloacimonadota bacterium]|nr:hypothetical protein [Candidatus Cloacimonadota bacterium]